MILLVTPSARGEDCAAVLREVTGSEIVLAESLHRATGLLRTNEYESVVLDQYLLETEADQSSTLMEHLGTAIPVQVNLAVSGMDRMVREVLAAVQRRKREEVIARRAAQKALYHELNSTVTALLLECDLVLATPGLPPAMSVKLETARELVKKLRVQLDSAAGKN